LGDRELQERGGRPKHTSDPASMTESIDRAEGATRDPGGTLVDQICVAIEQDRPYDGRLSEFAREFLAKAPRAMLMDRPMEDVEALTRGAFRLLERGKEDGVTVEVIDPEEEGWSAPVTVIRAEVRDRPFIVDTIREYLNGENLPIQHYVYPVIGVVRGAEGFVERVTSESDGSPRALIHCEIPRIGDPARRAEIQGQIERRLDDVVAATDDFGRMLETVEQTAATVAGYGERFPERASEFADLEAFLRWLTEDNFVFLGYRAYEITRDDGEATLRVVKGSGLGILRREEESAWAGGVALADVAEEIRRRLLEAPALITSKTNAESTVHRRARMDYIGVKRYTDDGDIAGEFRFLGLFTSKAYAEHAEEIPILRRKLERILEASGAPPGSHDYKEIITIFNSMPKEDLFQASVEELDREVQTVLSLLFSDEVKATIRADPLRRGVSVMVILPRGRFSGEVRNRIQQAIVRRFEGTLLNYHLAMAAGDQARLHFYLSSSPEVVDSVSSDDLVRDIWELIRSWEDRLEDELVRRYGEAEAARLAALYGPAFLEEYRAATLPEVAVQDLEEFERLRSEGERVAITLREPRGRGRAEAFRGVTLLKLYLVEERLILSDFMPILDHTGLRVLEVTPFAVSGPGLPEMMIYSFAVQGPDGSVLAADRAEILPEALLAVRRGDTPNDPFNALILHAGLPWREVDVLRVFANYAFQSGILPTRFATARALARHPELARIIIELFRSRFDPEGLQSRSEAERKEGRAALNAAASGALDTVTTLSDDRAIRRLLSLVEATTRTNYFRHGGAAPTHRSGGAPYIALKIRCADVDELRRNRLLYEIFVFSNRMEGIHLRGSAVSRGGIRWSERADDYRTEVLGLVQTQIVKNAVIVPGGSKGGFITKRLHEDRAAILVEIADQYRTLIRGLLDLTDNLVEGRMVPPTGVVCHDDPDPYLVVAADKGTAHLSDVANEVAAEYEFWLGDAFASGGSFGYDHKRYGITARGAWESVKRHFREMGKDIQTEPFTVAGIGDMSGDVFGNGMLLSRQIRLVAAFDHRHVFIDPDPDPAAAYAERERLFDMNRSSWADYDRSALSAGAMIVPRSAKDTVLTQEAKRALGVDPSVDALDGEGLVRAVLCAPVELLWNGGIGTYVKHDEETNAEVGDPANDPVRIRAGELRCQVIGEGGNLGLTQRARIAYALRRGRLNTDAIDNSGGVDMSDHEVNLKILLTPLVASGEITLEERNRLLDEMGGDVTRLVLANNRRQSLAVSLDESRSRESLAEFAGLITTFERDRLLERAPEGIPSSDELAERAREGIGLTRPTLCVLLAYAKLHTKNHVLASALPDDPATLAYLIDYFPTIAAERAGVDRIAEHRLRREVTATQLVNDLVDIMGAAFVHRVARETGRSVDAVVAAWLVANRSSGATEIRATLDDLEERFSAETVYRWLFGLARVLERTTRWTLSNVEPHAPLEHAIGDLRSGLERLRGDFATFVRGADRELFDERLAELTDLGVDRTLAQRIITLRFLPELLDILRIARESGADPIGAARAYYAVADDLELGWIQQVLRAQPRDELWEKRFAQTLDADMQRAHRAISRRLLECVAEERPLDDCMSGVLGRSPREAELYRQLVEELRATENPSLAGAAVAVRALLELGGG
jgi:glutamate dehydrogenase